MVMSLVAACTPATTPAAPPAKPAAAATPAAGGVATAPAASGSSSDVIKIGVVGPLTGAAAVWGLALRGGVELAAEEVKQKGGVMVGGKRHTLQVIAYDDKYQAAEAVTVTNRLISEDKVSFIIGPIGSDSALAMQPIVEQNKVLMLENSLSPKALSPSSTYTYRVILSPSEYVGPMYQWVSKNLSDVKRIALLTPNDEGGRGVTDAAEAAIKGVGLASESQYYERGTQDFSPVLTRLMAFQPQAIDLAGCPPADAGTVVKQLRSMGYTGRFFKSGGSAIGDIVRIAGAPAAEGTLYYLDVNLEAPAVASYANTFKARYNADLNSLSPWFHDATLMLTKAIEEAGTVDSTKVRDKLGTMTYTGPLVGQMKWGGQKTYSLTHQILGKWFLMEWRDGKQQIKAELEAE